MKKILLIAVLAIGMIFTACQKAEAPSTETSVTETPTIKEDANTKTLESSAFTITVPANLTVEATEGRGRIQNFTPDNDLYSLKDGEYYIELVFNTTEEIYSEGIFRSEYNKVEATSFNGAPAFYGTESLPAGDSSPSVGYYIPNTMVIGIYSESSNGFTSAKDLLKSLTLK